MALKDIPTKFEIDSEEDVRFAIAQYFQELDFDLDELSFEDHFTIQLGRGRFRAENGYRAGRNNLESARGYSDLLLARNGIPLAIVEIKRIDHPLNEEDAWQAISYARLLRSRVAPYAIVTNGKNTKIYDVLADSDDLVEIGEPTDATWSRKGQTLSPINEDLKFQATRKLIGLNVHTLETFCKQQVESEIDDLKGTAWENKIYIPALYLERKSVSESFHKWLTTEFPCFAVVGESGIGKTNSMCAMAESVAQDHFVLFYSAKNLAGGLREAIANDFVWEFKRERSIAHIATRIDDIAKTHSKHFIIFIDALDKFTGQLSVLRAELRDFLKHIKDSSIRLCISCKSHDWKTFVIDNSQTFNRIAKLTFPPINIDSSEKAQAQNVGFWIGQFTESEIQKAFDKYRGVYFLKGELKGEARIACHTPLNLRLLAEAYRETDQRLPSDLARNEFFNSFWERKIGNFESPQEVLLAEKIVCTFAEKMISTDLSELNESRFSQELDNELLITPVYEEVFRFGLLRRVERAGDVYVTFPFEQLRSFIFTSKARHWHNIVSDKQMITEIRDAFKTRYGRDVLLFYLVNVNPDWLLRLIKADIEIFVNLMALIEQVKSEELFQTSSSGAALYTKLRTRADRYVHAYSIIRDQFPALKRRSLPHTDGDVGLWVHGRYYGFRTTSKKFPQRIVLLDGPQISDSEREDLQPEGKFFSDGLIDDLIAQLPEKLAFERFTEQIAQLIARRLLDESACPVILSERITSILSYNPGIYLEKSPRGPCWQWLGYSSSYDACNDSCSEIMLRSNNVIEQWLQCIEQASQKPLERWYMRHLTALLVLRWNLEQLQSHSKLLVLPSYTSNNIFSYLHRNDSEKARQVTLSIAQSVFKNFNLLLEHNFPFLTGSFHAYKNQGKRLIIEVAPLGNFAFIWLPSAPDGLPEVRFVDPINKPLGKVISLDISDSVWQSFDGIRSEEGAAISYVEEAFTKTDDPNNYSSIGFMPDILVETTLDGEIFKEPHAVITSIRSPVDDSITELAYQLIINELPSTFGPSFSRKLGEQQFQRTMNQSDQFNLESALKFVDSPVFQGIRCSAISINPNSSGITWNELCETE